MTTGTFVGKLKKSKEPGVRWIKNISNHPNFKMSFEKSNFSQTVVRTLIHLVIIEAERDPGIKSLIMNDVNNFIRYICKRAKKDGINIDPRSYLIKERVTS